MQIIQVSLRELQIRLFGNILNGKRKDALLLTLFLHSLKLISPRRSCSQLVLSSNYFEFSALKKYNAVKNGMDLYVKREEKVTTTILRPREMSRGDFESDLMGFSSKSASSSWSSLFGRKCTAYSPTHTQKTGMMIVMTMMTRIASRCWDLHLVYLVRVSSSMQTTRQET